MSHVALFFTRGLNNKLNTVSKLVFVWQIFIKVLNGTFIDYFIIFT